MDGATIEQCGRLLDELEEFRGLVDAEGLSDHYRDLLDDGLLHFQAYRAYLGDPGGASSYEDYLDRLPRPSDTPEIH